MSGRIFQNVVLQLKENTDRTVGVIDGEGIVIACSELAMIGQRWAEHVPVINAAGGAIQFELKSEDDVNDGETSVNAYNNLMDWGMQLLVGPTTTGPSVSVAAKCFDERTFMLTPSASSTDVTAGKDNVFQVCFTDPGQGTSSADYMAENMADAKIYILYQNDDAYSQGIRDAFVSEAEAKGLTIVDEGTFTKDTSTDFSVQLTAAQAAIKFPR